MSSCSWKKTQCMAVFELLPAAISGCTLTDDCERQQTPCSRCSSRSRSPRSALRCSTPSWRRFRSCWPPLVDERTPTWRKYSAIKHCERLETVFPIRYFRPMLLHFLSSHVSIFLEHCQLLVRAQTGEWWLGFCSGEWLMGWGGGNGS